jgi:hypothetical protein
MPHRCSRSEGTVWAEGLVDVPMECASQCSRARRLSRRSQFAPSASRVAVLAVAEQAIWCLCGCGFRRAACHARCSSQRARVRRAWRRLLLANAACQRSFGWHRIAPAAPIRPTQQRAGAPTGAPGLLLCQDVGVSARAPDRRPERAPARESSRRPHPSVSGSAVSTTCRCVVRPDNLRCVRRIPGGNPSTMLAESIGSEDGMRRAAQAATIGLAALMVFQAALAAGAPLGDAHGAAPTRI